MMRRLALVVTICLTSVLLIGGVAMASPLADSDTIDGGSPGIPGWFIAIAVVIGAIAIIGTIVRVSTSRKIARDAGMDPNTATLVGLDATYLASAIHTSGPPPSEAAPPLRTSSERLAELTSLKDAGQITPAEYESRRQAIIDSV
jgi:hypothetical protein